MNVIDEIELELVKFRAKKDNIRYLRQICVLEYMKEQFRMIINLTPKEEYIKPIDEFL